jgi:hypothetical protein
MTLARWALRDGRLAIISEAGQALWPNASEVFRSAFQGERSIRGLDVTNPLDADLPLSFSRLPAAVAVRLSGSYPKVVPELGVMTDFGFVPASSEADSIIADGKWYPIHVAELEEATNWLGQRNIHSGSSISVGDVISLRLAPNPPVQLLMQVRGSASDIATSAGQSASSVLSGLNCEL